MSKRVFTGHIVEHINGDHEDALFLTDHKEPIAEELEYIHNKQVTVRYWITDVRCSMDEAITAFLHRIDGVGDAKYLSRYSELTGYLWTDEDLNVGGHDLLEELRSNIGKFIILEVEV